jgi:hypothetical protein
VLQTKDCEAPEEARFGLGLAAGRASDSEPPVRCDAASSPSGEARRLSLLLRLDLRPLRLATPPAASCAERQYSSGQGRDIDSCRHASYQLPAVIMDYKHALTCKHI